jgi:hypothetical protein
VTVVHGVQSAVLAAVANLTVSQGSTTGVQSLFLGTPSAYVVAEGAAAPSIQLSKQGLIPWANSSSGFERIYNGMRAEGFNFDVSQLDQAGLPTGATGRISQLIVEHVCGVNVEPSN